MAGIGLLTLALACAIAGPRWLPHSGTRLDAVTALLDRYGAILVAAASAAVIWFTWGAVSPRPSINDEYSYALQAQIFAGGHWTAPKPPIPEFFQQPHVLVEPVVASKYPPGHALLLSLGVRLGFPPLMPLLLTGLSAALLFLLARRVANTWVAILGWLIWLSTPFVLEFQPSYFSELTTGAALLGAWWCLLRWRDTHSRWWLCAVAFAVAWGAITRPLTMLALALPICAVVLKDITKKERAADLALALIIGIAVLGVLPIWSVKTTGSWTVTPMELYRRDYLPLDKLGFTPDTSTPQRVLQPPMQQLYRNILRAHRAQSFTELPRTILARAQRLEASLASDHRLPLLVFGAVGLACLTPELAFAAISALLLLVAYLPYAYPDYWTLYYLEIAPVAAVLVASGMWVVTTRVVCGTSRVRLAGALLAGVLATLAIPEVMAWRETHSRRFDRNFQEWLARVASRDAIVFIRYDGTRHDFTNVVHNYPDLNRARVWVVHDLGVANERLRHLAPDREILEFDDDQVARGPRSY